jgi:hypothetical protein
MANYKVHSTDQGAFKGPNRPLNAVRAYYKVRELRGQGFKTVTLMNADTGEEIIDVESFVRDSPRA